MVNTWSVCIAPVGHSSLFFYTQKERRTLVCFPDRYIFFCWYLKDHFWVEFCQLCLLLETAVKELPVQAPQNSELEYWDLVSKMEKNPNWPKSLVLAFQFVFPGSVILPWFLRLKFTLEKINEAFLAWMPQ